MMLSIELLNIAKMDLQASRVLYENELYSQAIFYFQQSVEKANKAFALITGQSIEKELREIGHQPIRIYKKTIEHQKNRFEQLKINLNKFPQLRSIKVLKKINIDKNLRLAEIYLSDIQDIEEERNDLIYISSWDIRCVLKKIESTKKEFEKEKRKNSTFRINEKDWVKEKKEIIEQFSIFSIFDSKQFEETKNNLEREDMRLFAEKLIKNLSETLCITIPLSTSLYYLSIVTSPHSSITRYPQDGLSPVNIYTKKLPIVKKLPELLEVQENVLNELKVLNKKFEHIDAGVIKT